MVPGSCGHGCFPWLPGATTTTQSTGSQAQVVHVLRPLAASRGAVLAVGVLVLAAVIGAALGDLGAEGHHLLTVRGARGQVLERHLQHRGARTAVHDAVEALLGGLHGAQGAGA